MQGSLLVYSANSADGKDQSFDFDGFSTSGAEQGESGRHQLPVTVGSGSKASIRLRSADVVGQHLSFDWSSRHATWTVTNLGPPDSVKVNGIDLGAGRGRLLNLSHCQIDIGICRTVFQRRPAEPIYRGKPVSVVPVGPEGIVIGRGTENPDGSQRPRIGLDPEIRTISSLQTEVRFENGQFVVENHNKTSSLRTILNGDQNFDVRPLVYGDCIQLPEYDYYTFQFTGSALAHIGAAGILQGRNLTRQIGKRQILSDCSIDIRCGDFIGVIGGSGQGKSTFLNALCGVMPASSGEVWMFGEPMRNAADMAKAGIGYVPQDDIVHGDLTVEEALIFAAQLRIKLTRRQIHEAVASVIETLGLSDRRKLPVGKLSGGQRKRVSIASELLASPRFLLLDEPTSGLDPKTEASLMDELVLLARKKRMGIVSTTHVLQSSHVFSTIGIIQGGRLIFNAPPADAARYFLVERYLDDDAAASASQRSAAASSSYGEPGSSGAGASADDSFIDPATLMERLPKVFGPIEERARAGMNAEQMEEIFKQSPYYKPLLPIEDAKTGADANRNRSSRPSLIKRASVLLRRQWALLIADKLNLLFLISQAFIIGALVGWVSENIVFQMFISVIATLWFGCSNAAQQIVGELAIFRRERLAGLGLNTYLISKMLFLTVITVAQAVVLFAAVYTTNNLLHPEQLSDYAGDDPEYDSKVFRETFFQNQPEFMASSDDSASATDSAPDSSAAATGSAIEADDFLVVDASDYVPEPVAVMRYQNPTRLDAASPNFALLETISTFFRLRENVIDYLGVKQVTVEPGDEFDEGPTRSWPLFVGYLIGLKWLALAAAAIVGVALGLTISALVRSPTQAVMWVPLILIPQILFGGFVVTKPEMETSVVRFSNLLPSFNLQRLMDVANVYGRNTPQMTNKTKIPGFFAAPPYEEETVRFSNRYGEQQEKYDKISPVNKSWQNLLVVRRSVGKRTKKPDRDSVENRRDVLFVMGQPYSIAGEVMIGIAVLGGWVLSCYFVILIGLRGKQSG